MSKQKSFKVFDNNTHEQIQAIEASGLLALTEIAGLENPLCKKTATADQEHDLLAFRNIGQDEFNKYIEYSVLGKSSVTFSQRKRKLATFGEKRVSKKVLTQLQKDIKLVQTCMHKKLLWSKISKQPVSSVADQYIPLPLAISDNTGQPQKGQKSYTTTTLETRYKSSNPTVFFNSFPPGWTPQCCILEGMFMINTHPTGSHKNFTAYGSSDSSYHSGPEVLLKFMLYLTTLVGSVKLLSSLKGTGGTMHRLSWWATSVMRLLVIWQFPNHGEKTSLIAEPVKETWYFFSHNTFSRIPQSTWEMGKCFS